MRIHAIDEVNNMSAKRVIEVNESSIVDLKAELIRKESLAKKVKLGDVESKINRQPKRPPVWAKPKKETRTVKSVSVTKKDDLSSEEQQALQKSRQALEAKSALYEKMAKGEIEDEAENEEDSRFLVDFHKKIYQKGDVDSEHSEELTSDDIPAPAGPDEEWVDYVDSLGRARTCLRKDLKHLQELDKNISDRKSSPPTLLSEDMKRELARQKWEMEEEEAASKPVGPVHYQNIRFDEIRNHGVGYYQFSTSEEERQEQMKTLDKLREQTMEQRARVQKLKEKRKAALDARLAKVRERRLNKMIQAGDAVDDKEKSEAVDSSTATGNEESKTEELAEESLPTAVREGEKSVSRQPDRKAPLPEWAQHKIQLPERPRASSHTDTRSERNAEFAPPSFYYEEDDSRSNKKKTWQETPKLFKQNAKDSETPETQTVGHQVNSATHDQQSQFPQLDQREGESHSIGTPHSVIPVPAELPPLPLPPQEYVRAPWAGHHWQPPLNVPPPWQPNAPPPFAPPMQYPWQPNPPPWQPYQVPPPPPFMRGGPPLYDPHANWNGNHPTPHSSPT